MNHLSSDFLIVGAGVIGLAMAREIKRRWPESSVTVIDKEDDVARHASGRNSGVLHAGFYYTADSLKARFCREGNKAWSDYCQTHGLALNRTGKVVVATSETELGPLHELLQRGKRNGVELTLIDERELEAIEPNARTCGQALYAPATAVVDPVAICAHLNRQLAAQGVAFLFSTRYVKRLGARAVQAGGHAIAYGTLVNCAGLYADKIARDFGASRDYTIIPFKGLYLKYTRPSPPVRTNIYPVPNLANPFLGVHFTMTVDGKAKIGPTATPAFWREHYQGWSQCRLSELASILGWEAKLFATNAFDFRRLAVEEMKKYRKRTLAEAALKLVKQADISGFDSWSKPGIRAQLLHKKSLKLVQDFVVERGEDSVHVLNAVSPAFTCSLPFAEWIAEHYLPR